ncbi:MAG TPA: hypothetical protein VF923_02465 [Gemmatimonadales bacterium]
MIRRTLLTLALVAAPALAVAQQPTQAPAQQPMAAAQDTTKAKPAAKPAKGKKGAKGHMKKPATAPRDTTKKP